MRDAGARKQKQPDQSGAASQVRRDFGHVKRMLTKTEGWLNARVIAEIAASTALTRELRASGAALESMRIALPQKVLIDSPVDQRNSRFER